MHLKMRYNKHSDKLAHIEVLVGNSIISIIIETIIQLFYAYFDDGKVLPSKQNKKYDYNYLIYDTEKMSFCFLPD